MDKARTNSRCDGWTAERRTAFLGALRVVGKVTDACAWAGMSVAGAYALAKRDSGFAATWDAALAARIHDRRPRAIKPLANMNDAALIRQLRRADAARHARPRGIVAQQKQRWA